jgi:GTP-binding protein
VRTSRTPGRTRLLNQFVFEERLAVVDLPGYGFAKMSKSERDKMAEMIRTYVSERTALRAIVLVVDARRAEVSELDLLAAEKVTERGLPLVIVATKADAVAKNRRLDQLRRIEHSLGVPSGTVLLASSRTGDGRGDLVRVLDEAVVA